MTYGDSTDSEQPVTVPKTAPFVISVSEVEDPNGDSLHAEEFKSCKAPLTTLSERSSLSTYQQTSSANDVDLVEQLMNTASPEAHLMKLQSIHREVKTRRRLKQLRKAVCFLITTLLPLISILTSICLILFGYFYNMRNLLVSGSIVFLATCGFLLHSCFTPRTGPNKFNPMSVPFSIAAEDLQDVDVTTFTEPNKIASSPKLEREHQTNQASEPPQSTHTLNVAFTDLQAKRLSLALARVVNSKLQVPSNYEADTPSGVLRMARRLTMASSAMGMVHDDGMMCEPTWLTGTHIRHGVRRSLAWNATGASRFYERNYD